MSLTRHLPLDQMPRPLKMGVPPAMSIKSGETYWGQSAPVEWTEAQRDATGVDDPGPQCPEARQLLQEINSTWSNARAATNAVRHATGMTSIPELPNRVMEQAPNTINVYSDGAVKLPASRGQTIGGFGIWWPDESGGGLERAGTAHNHMHHEKWRHGTAMWACLHGPWHSSHRAELSALVVAMHAQRAIHIGIDNKAVVDKARQLIQLGKKAEADARWHRKPLKKQWSLQTDGDLWWRFWTLLEARGAHSIEVSKVKGHATQEHVEAGIVTQVDRRGNHQADAAANTGVSTHRPGTHSLMAWVAARKNDTQT